jgi:hypothetical protein
MNFRVVILAPDSDSSFAPVRCFPAKRNVVYFVVPLRAFFVLPCAVSAARTCSCCSNPLLVNSLSPMPMMQTFPNKLESYASGLLSREQWNPLIREHSRKGHRKNAQDSGFHRAVLGSTMSLLQGSVFQEGIRRICGLHLKGA